MRDIHFTFLVCLWASGRGPCCSPPCLEHYNTNFMKMHSKLDTYYVFLNHFRCLIMAGCSTKGLHKSDGWIYPYRAINGNWAAEILVKLSKEVKNLIEELQEKTPSVECLRVCCRKVIRKTLATPIGTRVEKLPLPQRLKVYLLLPELDDI